MADARQPLLAYAALVLEHIIRIAKPEAIVFSTYGVREGLLYEMLPEQERAKDGLASAAQTLNLLLSRSARHAGGCCGRSSRKQACSPSRAASGPGSCWWASDPS